MTYALSGDNSGYRYVGEHKTNNEAEYAGLLLGIQAAAKLGTKQLIVKGDSILVLHQVGHYARKPMDVWPRRVTGCQVSRAVRACHVLFFSFSFPHFFFGARLVGAKPNPLKQKMIKNTYGER